jgi:hypothetical protein
VKFTAEWDVPDLRLAVNQRDMVAAMATTATHRIQSRARRGVGTNGPLERPKDGGRPINRTGEMVQALQWLGKIGRNGQPFAVVYPLGSRGDERRRDKLARRRTRMLRAAAAIGAALQGLSGFAVTGVERKKRGRGLKLAGVRSRAGGTNAAVASILANAPKDPNGIKAHRAIYEWVGANRGDEHAMAQEAMRVARFTLEAARAKLEVRRGR